jgi:hypothetical protein
VGLGTFPVGTDIEVAIKETGTVYMVPNGTNGDTASIFSASVAAVELPAYTIGYISTVNLTAGSYIFYAVDGAGNVSEASSEITLEENDPQVNVSAMKNLNDINFLYKPENRLIEVSSINELSRIIIYDILGNIHMAEDIQGKEYLHAFNKSEVGIYLVWIMDEEGKVYTGRFFCN